MGGFGFDGRFIFIFLILILFLCMPFLWLNKA